MHALRLFLVQQVRQRIDRQVSEGIGLTPLPGRQFPNIPSVQCQVSIFHERNPFFPHAKGHPACQACEPVREGSFISFRNRNGYHSVNKPRSLR